MTPDWKDDSTRAQMLVRRLACGCAPCMVRQFDLCENLERVGPWRLVNIVTGDAAAAEVEHLEALDAELAEDAWANALVAGDFCAVDARLPVSAAYKDSALGFTIIRLDRPAFV